MTTAAQIASPPQKRWITWTARVMSAIAVLLLVQAAVFAFLRTPQVLEGMAKFGYPESLLALTGVLALGSAALYVIPRTAVLGGLFMTAYFGAAVATHLRIGDPGWPLPVLAAIFTWGGLWGRDARVRELLPLRKR